MFDHLLLMLYSLHMKTQFFTKHRLEFFAEFLDRLFLVACGASLFGHTLVLVCADFILLMIIIVIIKIHTLEM